MEENAIKNVYRRNRKTKQTKVEVLTEAQKIAFAPLTFQVISALLQFNVIQVLSKESLYIEQIIEACNLSEYTVTTLFDAALCIGLVTKDENGKFSNTALAEAFLYDEMTVANFNFVKDVCYLGANELADSFLQFKPVGLQKHFVNSDTIYEVLPKLPSKMLKSWYDFDHHYSDDCFLEVLNIMFKHKPVQVYDIGGNTGKFERACLKYSDNCCINLIDLPVNIDVAKRKFIEEKADLNRLKFHGLNILDKENNLPIIKNGQNTAVLMSQFLDCFSKEQIKHILQKVSQRIDENSKVYILEPFIDNQTFKGAAYALSHTSLYFTCMANGYSKMYNEYEMVGLVNDSNLRVLQTYYNIGKYDYTLLECVKV